MPGYVRVADDEANRIAAFLGMSPHDFIQTYTVLARDRGSLNLTERDDGACIFLNPNSLCMIHPVKPEQCRNFPDKWRMPGFEKVCKARPKWSDS